MANNVTMFENVTNPDGKVETNEDIANEHDENIMRVDSLR